MDYTVGSLSDIITGSNTPNKKSVKKKLISPKKEPEDSIDSSNFQTVKKEVISPKIKSQSSIDSSNFQTSEEQTRTSGFEKKNRTNVNKKVPSAKKFKTKRKREENDEDNGPVVKKSSNSENAEKRIKLKNETKIEEDPELVARTIFVGNLPITSDTKKIKKFFGKFGKVESVRIRGVPVANLKTPKKVAVIKKEFHSERKSFFGFVRFEDQEDAVKATEANGVLYQDHHLRVHLCDSTEKPDENKAIFVGNLSFYAEEDDLWKLFESCGPISSVRIVRDNRTGIGKGFGYVNFKESDSVTLALEMENVKLKDRELRISICNINAAKKGKKDKAKKKKVKKVGGNKEQNTAEINETVKKENDINSNKSFEGVKIAKKKKKFDKGLLQKKRLMKQVAPK